MRVDSLTGLRRDSLRHVCGRIRHDDDAEFDAILAELVEAGYVEEYTSADGQPAMRLTPSGEQVARQLAMVAEDDAAAMMAGLLGDEIEG